MKMKIVVYGILIVSAVISDYSSADGDAGEKDADLYHSKYACTNRLVTFIIIVNHESKNVI